MKCPYCKNGIIDLWDTGYDLLITHYGQEGELKPCKNRKWVKLFAENAQDELTKNYKSTKEKR